MRNRDGATDGFSWPALGECIGAAIGAAITLDEARPVGGGCINSAYHARGGGREFFIKLNSADRLAMFAAEAEGLRELDRTATVRVPSPVCHGRLGDRSFLVLTYISLGRADERTMALLGRQLAALHRVTQARFGWRQDNTIGATSQPNEPNPDWLGFWREHRLGFQLRLAARQGYAGALQRRGERLLDACGTLFAGYSPRPALLHGDLWGGNAAADGQGQPVIFDPAVYYGDREADIAMTELFGGFSPSFYAAYGEAYPLDENYHGRRDFYNLYHILNHLNLFGGGYLGQAERLMDRILAEIAQ